MVFYYKKNKGGKTGSWRGRGVGVLEGGERSWRGGGEGVLEGGRMCPGGGKGVLKSTLNTTEKTDNFGRPLICKVSNILYKLSNAKKKKNNLPTKNPDDFLLLLKLYSASQMLHKNQSG